MQVVRETGRIACDTATEVKSPLDNFHEHRKGRIEVETDRIMP